MTRRLVTLLTLWLGILTVVLAGLGVWISLQQLRLNELSTRLEQSPPILDFLVQPVIFKLDGSSHTAEVEFRTQGHSLHNIRIDGIHVEDFKWTTNAASWFISDPVIPPYVKFGGPTVLDFPVGESRYIQTTHKLNNEIGGNKILLKDGGTSIFETLAKTSRGNGSSTMSRI